jgi:Zn-dependent protease
LQPIDLNQVLIGFTVLIVSLAVHEAAHAWSADLLGDPTALRLGRMSLNPAVHVDPIGTVLFPLVSMLSGFPLIGWAKPVPVSIDQLGADWQRKLALIAAAGPASNLVLAAVAAGLIRLGLAAPGVFGDVVGPLLLRTWQLNVLLAVFNMLPVPPLDAGNLLAGLLRGPVGAMFARVCPYGFLILGGLMLTGLLSAIVDPIRGALQSVLL